MKISLLSLISMISMLSGVILGIVLIVNIFNGNFLDTVYPYSWFSPDPSLYPDGIPDLNSSYYYTQLSSTGELIFRLCGLSFGVGVACIVIPIIIDLIKHGKFT